MVEVLVALSLVALLVVAGTPALEQAAATARAHAAARYMASRIQAARLEAARRGAAVAIRFDAEDEGIRFQLFADGNGNGVRAADIDRGIDLPLGPPDALRHHFRDADLRVLFSATGIDGGPAVEAGSDPVRLGSGRLLSWSPSGTGTSGTVYVSGPRGPQLAVRVFGTTGRVRVLRFDVGSRTWRGH
jgi:type II secretory pathway pseudopilin PulG